MSNPYFSSGPVIQLPNPYAPWELEEYRNPLVSEVAQVGSFEEYCRGHFGWEWIEGIRLRLSEGKLPVGKTSSIVPNPVAVTMTNADILRIEFTRMDRHHFYADAIIPADIELAQHMSGQLVTDKVSQWYRDRFIFEFFPGGYHLDEESVSVYNRDEKPSGIRLSEYLIPMLSEEELETEAEDMLRLYYPEAFLNPVSIDGQILAKRMGLSISEVTLPPEQQLMGQAVFQNCVIDIMDADANRKKQNIQLNTILVNRSCNRNAAQRNDTILHECVHHYEHDLFTWGQSLYSSDIYGIDIPVIEGAFTLDGQSPMFWAETQARAMTYRIKMNRLQTEKKVQELNEQLLLQYPGMEQGRRIERIIQKLADFFGTSKQCARRRMLELGYESVRGVLNYVNRKYVPPYFCSPGLLQKDQTFLISMEGAVDEYGRNERFRELVSSGHYVYVEGKFCVRKPEYVRTGANGKLYMTKMAREAVEQCCLLFTYAYDTSVPRYCEGRLNREPQIVEVRGQKVVVPLNSATPGLCSPEDFLKEAAWITSVRAKIGGMDFCDALTFLMKERRMTSEKLEEASQISNRTISRLRNDPDYAVSHSQIVALAVALKLPPAISSDLMAKVGLCLRNTQVHNAYGMILSSFYTMSIMVVNEYLVAMGLEPLTQMAKAS